MPPETKILTTCSFWKMYRECHQKNHLRYREEIVPLATPEYLTFGKIMHSALQVWDGTRSLKKTIEYLDGVFQMTAHQDRKALEMYCKLQALVAYYALTYKDEKFKTYRLNQSGAPMLEAQFEIPIVNPSTGATSRTFVLGGKIDRIVEDENGGIWIVERKSASSIDADYIERLWIDFQNHLYVHAARVFWMLPVLGVLYDVAAKPTIKLCEPSARRVAPETAEEFLKRLDDWYTSGTVGFDGVPVVKPMLFYRQRMEVTPKEIERIQAELWDLTQQYLASMNRDYFALNTDACFRWNSACGYWKLCRSGGDPHVKESFYRHEVGHIELQEVE